ncbi:MAG TPA: hypothetical protein VFH31_21265 [Pyrinomonadaceae bacterium]|nr:hypothetical protein [Pyrinomonadaceae bacterium]
MPTKALPPYGRFSSYTNDELLRMLDEKRTQSPIIDELCHRLEAAFEMNMDLFIEDYRPNASTDKEHEVEPEVLKLKMQCPCCEHQYTFEHIVE